MAGGKNNQNPGVPSVETAPCPTGGTHLLTNTLAGHTRCFGCGASWADLDARIRARLPKPKVFVRGRKPPSAK